VQRLESAALQHSNATDSDLVRLLAGAGATVQYRRGRPDHWAPTNTTDALIDAIAQQLQTRLSEFTFSQAIEVLHRLRLADKVTPALLEHTLQPFTSSIDPLGSEDFHRFVTLLRDTYLGHAHVTRHDDRLGSYVLFESSRRPGKVGNPAFSSLPASARGFFTQAWDIYQRDAARLWQLPEAGHVLNIFRRLERLAHVASPAIGALADGLKDPSWPVGSSAEHLCVPVSQWRMADLGFHDNTFWRPLYH